MVAYPDMLEIDRYALHLTQDLIEKVVKAYTDFEPYVIYQQVHNFCVVDMSSFYLDILKDRLYVYRKGSRERKSAQSALFKIIQDLTRLMAPVLSFTAEEIWDHLPAYPGKESSVHVATMPVKDEGLKDAALAAKWQRFIQLRQEVSKVMEQARRDKVIGHPLDALVRLTAKGETLEFLGQVKPFLREVLIVSEIEVLDGDGPYIESDNFKELKVEIARASGAKCPRCWNYSRDIGADAKFPEVCARCAAQLG
jgi:isoleucyl-tRNA synthetase